VLDEGCWMMGEGWVSEELKGDEAGVT